MNIRRPFRSIAAALLVSGALVPIQASAQSAPPVYADWSAVVEAAQGSKVYFNAWAGDAKINAYLEWVAAEVHDLAGIELIHVKVTDTAEVVARIEAEQGAGRSEGGSVDLVWINGENFATMKARGLLYGPFAGMLPNMALVDTAGKPTTLLDFSVPTDGFESPWGMAQLVFIADSAVVANPPRDPQALLDWAAENPGRFAYPAPPDFIGTTVLKQLMLSLSDDPSLFAAPPADTGAFNAATAPLWAYLDRLTPHLWRSGAVYPASYPALRQLMNDSEIDIMMAFNPGEASSAIAQGLLPDTARTFVLDGGSIGNTHFVAIPFNASAPAGALFVANFLLSPAAQARKANPEIWGDPTVLAVSELAPADRALFDALPFGIADLEPADLGATLPEPHAAWVPLLETAWAERYGH